MIFTLQYLDLRKIDEAEADISHAKEALDNASSTVFRLCLNEKSFLLFFPLQLMFIYLHKPFANKNISLD